VCSSDLVPEKSIIANFVGLTTGLILSSLLSVAANAQNIIVNGPTYNPGVSGVSSNSVTTSGNTVQNLYDTYGVYGITFWERRNHPCKIQVHTRNLINRNAFRNLTPLDDCGSSGGTERSKVFVGWNNATGAQAGIDTSLYFVKGLRICLNNEKIKGVRLFSAQLLPDGTLTDPPMDEALDPFYPSPGFSTGSPLIDTRTDQSTMKRSNCNSSRWSRELMCEDDQIVVAVKVHALRNQEPENYSGMELICRRVTTTLADIPVPTPFFWWRMRN